MEAAKILRRRAVGRAPEDGRLPSPQRKLLTQLLRQMRLNRQVFITSQRAWLALKEAKVVNDLNWEIGNVLVHFRFTNIGNTPARNASVYAQIHLQTNSSISPNQAYNALAMR
jgi:hypothetical protein